MQWTSGHQDYPYQAEACTTQPPCPAPFPMPAPTQLTSHTQPCRIQPMASYHAPPLHSAQGAMPHTIQLMASHHAMPLPSSQGMPCPYHPAHGFLPCQAPTRPHTSQPMVSIPAPSQQRPGRVGCCAPSSQGGCRSQTSQSCPCGEVGGEGRGWGAMAGGEWRWQR